MPAEFKGKVVVITGGEQRHRPRHRARVCARGRADRAGLLVGAQSGGGRQGGGRGGAGADHGRRRSAQARGCQQVFKRVNERFQRCDVLVNNAGATRAGNFLT